MGVFPDNFVKIIPTSLSEEIITELLNVQISQNGTPYSIGTSETNKYLDKKSVLLYLEFLEEEIFRLKKGQQNVKEARSCKICMENDINMAFYPCGHLISCAICAKTLKDCPMCRKNIKGILKTYMS